MRTHNVTRFGTTNRDKTQFGCWRCPLIAIEKGISIEEAKKLVNDEVPYMTTGFDPGAWVLRLLGHRPTARKVLKELKKAK